MNKGFTLVELSIVLVITGLLIGGILVAQSMIGTVKIQRQVKQIQEFDTALNNFMTKYNGLPGDVASLGCNSGRCNDGRIQDLDSAANNQPSMWGFGGETASVWPNLQQSGFMHNKATFSSTINGNFKVTTSSPNSPQAAIDEKSGVIMGISSYGPEGKQWNIYEIADFSPLTNSYPDNIQNLSKFSITPSDALALDQKMDDGNADAGYVYPTRVALGGYNGADFGGSHPALGGNAAGSLSCTNNSTKYSTQNPGKNCALAIVALIQQGGLAYK